MNVIRQRVADNGHRTDGFQDLIFKAYLISEKRDSSKSCNEYSPLYIWQNNDGMNKFIFDGYYDNILSSFGWQKINIGIPITFSLEKDDCTSKVLIYNPDKWKYVEYYFYKDRPIKKTIGKIYSILHLSQ